MERIVLRKPPLAIDDVVIKYLVWISTKLVLFYLYYFKVFISNFNF